jgi:multisubunit Na+/H+ antiporter MnhE subunit
MNAVQLLTVLLGALVWFGLLGRATLEATVLGVLVVGSACWLTGRIAQPRMRLAAWRIPGVLLRGIAYLSVRVLPAMVFRSFEIAWACLARRHALRGGIVAVDVPGAAPEALVALAFGIASSPDRQIVHIDLDARTLYVHAILPPDPATLRAEVRRDLERYTQGVRP